MKKFVLAALGSETVKYRAIQELTWDVLRFRDYDPSGSVYQF